MKRAVIDRKSVVGGGAHECGNSKDLPKEISHRKIIDMLFDKVLDDPLLSPFFDDIDDERLHEKQELLMEILFEGLQVLETIYLRQAHMGLMQKKGLSEIHWEKFVHHFEEVLKELGPLIPAEKRQSALQNIKATRMYFKPPKPGE